MALNWNLYNTHPTLCIINCLVPKHMITLIMIRHNVQYEITNCFVVVINHHGLGQTSLRIAVKSNNCRLALNLALHTYILTLALSLAPKFFCSVARKVEYPYTKFMSKYPRFSPRLYFDNLDSQKTRKTLFSTVEIQADIFAPFAWLDLTEKIKSSSNLT